jgi:AAA domain
VTAFERVFEAVERNGLRIGNCNREQARAMVECPVHDDRRPSLSIRGADAKALLHCFAGCQPERVVEALGLEWRDCFDDDFNPGEAFNHGFRRNGRPAVVRTDTSWRPVALDRLLSGAADLEPPPGSLRRSDGVGLLYAGKVHSIFSEPEGCKGWLSLAAAAEYLAAGDNVTLLDFEDTPAVAVERLHALGVGDDLIRARFHYVRPDEPLDERGQRAIAPALAASALVVFDGVTEALALHGIDMNSNVEVARWLTSLPRRVAAAGAVVVLLDHVWQLCHEPTCNALPLNELGAPVAVSVRKWWCERHRHLAAEGDMEPRPSRLQFSPSGAIVEVDPEEEARQAAEAERRQREHEEKLAARRVEAAEHEEHERLRKEAFRAELGPGIPG